MPNNTRLLRSALTLLMAPPLAMATVSAQPKLKSSAPSSYLPGEQVAGDTLLLDRSLAEHALKDVVRSDTEVAVLILFGGAGKRPPIGESMRGGIWCGDSFDDFAIQRALINHFKDRPVQFIAVAVPPVYSDRFGFPKDVFLVHPDDDETYRAEAWAFIEANERLREEGIIPFQSLYYDPKFRLAQNKAEFELGPDFGERYEWQGRLKWHLDARRYGTPTIWLLDGQLRVVGEPFFGNEYDRTPAEIHYGFQEIQRAIESRLSPDAGVQKTREPPGKRG